ncbi:MAG: ferritin-like domain-containing protein [Candidatus Sumerlaeaceae bacterium]|nr:ferritin-like domain-containing protein [Candidatus Sumerlaeaceae bacterium]
MGSKKDKGKSGDKTAAIAAELRRSYEMEIETVINYLANSVHLDGLLASEIKTLLKADIAEELMHAQQLADRIKILGGTIPGSLALNFDQKGMQPPSDTTDVVSVVKGVIAAEEGAIAQYQKIAEMCDGVDLVTQDLVVTLMGDEQKHRRDFVGFLRELERRLNFVRK